MITAGRRAKILLIDSNVYFAKKLGDALKRCREIPAGCPRGPHRHVQFVPGVRHPARYVVAGTR